MTLLSLAACLGRTPFVNEPPVLLSANGAPIDPDHEGYAIGPVADASPERGVPLHLSFEVEDPERDAVQVLFPLVVGEVRFAPDDTEGDWIPPLDHDVVFLDVYLLDDHDPPAGRTYTLQFGEVPDSGYGWITSSGY